MESIILVSQKATHSHTRLDERKFALNSWNSQNPFLPNYQSLTMGPNETQQINDRGEVPTEQTLDFGQDLSRPICKLRCNVSPAMDFNQRTPNATRDTSCWRSRVLLIYS